MTKLLNWLRRNMQCLLGKHDARFVRNIYGDEIIATGYARSLWKCRRCGKLLYNNYLQKGQKETKDKPCP